MRGEVTCGRGEEGVTGREHVHCGPAGVWGQRAGDMAEGDGWGVLPALQGCCTRAFSLSDTGVRGFSFLSFSFFFGNFNVSFK